MLRHAQSASNGVINQQHEESGKKVQVLLEGRSSLGLAKGIIRIISHESGYNSIV